MIGAVNRVHSARAFLFALALSASGGATPTDGLLDPCTPAQVSGAENELFKDMPPGTFGYQDAKLLFDGAITAGCQSSPLLFCPSCEISRVQIVLRRRCA